MIAVDYIIMLPEIFLSVSILLLLLLGSFSGDRLSRQITYLSLLVVIIVEILLFLVITEEVNAFSGFLVQDNFARFGKSLVLIATVLVLIMFVDYSSFDTSDRVEHPLLALIACLGMMIMISANDLLSFYVGIELQSLSLYILATSHRGDVNSAEAGVKYFVLGALSSGLMIYGISLVYGGVGDTSFSSLRSAEYSGLLVAGMVFILCGFAFKLTAAPFHMWAPDVYQGVSTPITAFLAAAPKVAAFFLLLRLLADQATSYVEVWQSLIMLLSVLSMVIGNAAALVQSNIKRLIAYSSISHSGFVLIGVSSGGVTGFASVVLYLSIYVLMTMGVFSILVALRRQSNQAIEEISDLSGLSSSHPSYALAMAIFMLSMAGIPPLAGFFGKLYLFIAAVESGLYGIFVIAAIMSVVGAYYYLKIIKVMYFDAPSGKLWEWRDKNDIRLAVLVTVLPIIFFFLVPQVFFSASVDAISSLFIN